MITVKGCKLMDLSRFIDSMFLGLTMRNLATLAILIAGTTVTALHGEKSMILFCSRLVKNQDT